MAFVLIETTPISIAAHSCKIILYKVGNWIAQDVKESGIRIFLRVGVIQFLLVPRKLVGEAGLFHSGLTSRVNWLRYSCLLYDRLHDLPCLKFLFLN